MVSLASARLEWQNIVLHGESDDEDSEMEEEGGEGEGMGEKEKARQKREREVKILKRKKRERLKKRAPLRYLMKTGRRCLCMMKLRNVKM